MLPHPVFPGPDLDTNAIGIIEASFMEANFEMWDDVAKSIAALPAEHQASFKQAMCKHALTEQAKTEGRDALIRQFNDIGTRRSGGGDYYAKLGKDQTEAALASICAFLRSLPSG